MTSADGSLVRHLDNVAAILAVEAADKRHSAVNAFEERAGAHGAAHGSVAAPVAEDEKAIDELDRANIVAQENTLFQTLTPTDPLNKWATSGSATTCVKSATLLFPPRLRPTDKQGSTSGGTNPIAGFAA